MHSKDMNNEAHKAIKEKLSVINSMPIDDIDSAREAIFKLHDVCLALLQNHSQAKNPDMGIPISDESHDESTNQSPQLEEDIRLVEERGMER
jgi:hypothetical protein